MLNNVNELEYIKNYRFIFFPCELKEIHLLNTLSSVDLLTIDIGDDDKLVAFAYKNEHLRS